MDDKEIEGRKLKVRGTKVGTRVQKWRVDSSVADPDP
jgi:hypothetical protein